MLKARDEATQRLIWEIGITIAVLLLAIDALINQVNR